MKAENPYAVISDVHANIEALSAVMADIKKRFAGRDHNIYFLGDIVGYGPNPNECTSMVRGGTSHQIAGNHDWAAIGLTSTDYFNPWAKAAIEWTAMSLSPSNKDYIRSLPLAKKVEDDNVVLVHATPREPEEWHYILSKEEADVNFYHFRGRVCFIGHSHRPLLVERQANGRLVTHEKVVELRRECKYIINVGSVGQPRDKDPRACYCTVEDEVAKLVRVEYQFEETQKKMKDAGLPAKLYERLALGR